MTLGASFRDTGDIEKALRKVRTPAGVKFFGMPIGSIISPGMVKMARAAHGDKRTDSMLVAQRITPRKEARRAHFQNQADVRAKKRAVRLEGNAGRRDAVARDKQIRGMGQPQAALVVAPTKAKAPTPVKAAGTPKPASAPSKTQATNKDVETLFDLVHADGKWNDTQITAAIELTLKLKATADPQTRQLLMALVKRLQKEE